MVARVMLGKRKKISKGIQSAVSQRLEILISQNEFPVRDLLNLRVSCGVSYAANRRYTRGKDFDYRPAGRVIGRGDR